MVEPQIVVLDVAGSSPVGHPILLLVRIGFAAEVLLARGGLASGAPLS